MSIEHKNSIEPLSKKGGCLDSAVGLFTLGRYGVETTVEVRYIDEFSGKIFQEAPELRAFIRNVEHVSRRIVKNR